jgi:hypothetical protein
MKKAKKPVGSRQAFTDAWNRIATSRDTWGVKYVYDYDGQRIWEAAIRYERKRARSAKGEQP